MKLIPSGLVYPLTVAWPSRVSCVGDASASL
jgi:hypothetical protein